MSLPADEAKARILLYTRAKWAIIGALAFLASGEVIFGLVSLSNAVIALFALLAVALVDQFIRQDAGLLEKSLADQLIKQNSDRLKKSLAEAQNSQKTAEEARLAVLRLLNDLKQSKEELEDKVRQRTIELEKANTFLESNVADRTTTLENSRKAILHMMRDLKDDLTKLLAVDKMKTEFISMVSHELRTPLTPIMGGLELMSDGKLGALSPQQKSTVDIMVRQSDHLLALIDSILDISRIELGKPIPLVNAPVALKSLIEETVEAMRFQMPAQLRLSVEIAADLPTIKGDATKLRRVLTNLLGNAVKFTPTDGEVLLRAFIDGKFIRVEVIDNGLGLERQNLEKVFEQFFQVDSSISRAAGGLGLGLSIARELVKLHGGELWAESAGLGQGSKFIFTLPIG